MAGLVGQGGVLALQLLLPGFQLIKQRIEVFGQLIEVGNMGGGHAAIEGAVDGDAVRHVRQVAQRLGNGPLYAARAIGGAQGAEYQAGGQAEQSAQDKASQGGALATELQFSDGLALIENRLADPLRQQQAGDQLFTATEQALGRGVETGHGLALLVEDRGAGHFLCRADQLQGFLHGGAVIEDHGGFQGIGQGAGDQLQVVLGVAAQGQQADQGQRQAAQTHGQQRDTQVGAV